MARSRDAKDIGLRQPQPLAQSLPPTKIHRPRPRERRRRLWRFGIIGLIVIGLIIGSLLLVKNRNPFSTEVRDAHDFPLYYPTKLPSGYMLDKNSIKDTSRAVFFNASKSGKKIVFTIQQKPSDTSDLYKKLLGDQAEASSSLGRVVVGKNQSRTVGTLAANQTLVLVTSQNISKDEMIDIMTHLKPTD